MPNDHYVPQMYLRNFSPDPPDGGCIRLINLGQRRYVACASIKGQCKRAGFHDYNADVERALGELEGAAAAVIKDIIAKGLPPKWLSNDHVVLATFIAIQRSRTLSAAEKAERHFNSLLRVAYEEEARKLGMSIGDYVLSSKYPVAVPLSVAADTSPMAVELGIHLFINETHEQFLTSDNPVIAHNKFCEGIGDRGVLGWNCAGILVFLPISPHHAVVLYDTNIYTLGNRRETASRIRDRREIQAMNAFQILNASENVYFCDASMVRPVLLQLEWLAAKRKTKRLVTVQTDPVTEGDMTSELIHQYERLLPLSLAVATVRIKRNMKRVPLGRRATMFRVETPSQGSWGGPHSSVPYPVRRSFSV